MIPTSVAAVAFLLALVPGYAFLRRTEGRRRPAGQSLLLEMLELVGIGVFTTGFVLGVAALVVTDELSALIRLDFPTGADVEDAVLLSFLILAASIAVALLFAQVVRWWIPSPLYASGVWQEVLSEERQDMVRHLWLELDDGRTIDGPLRSFTDQAEVDGRRQVSLKSPIRMTLAGSSSAQDVEWDSMIVESDALRYIALKYVPRGKTPT